MTDHAPEPAPFANPVELPPPARGPHLPAPIRYALVAITGGLVALGASYALRTIGF